MSQPLLDPAVIKEPPTLTKIREAVSQLNGGKASAISGISAELLKAGSKPMAWSLHTVLAAI